MPSTLRVALPHRELPFKTVNLVPGNPGEKDLISGFEARRRDSHGIIEREVGSADEIMTRRLIDSYQAGLGPADSDRPGRHVKSRTKLPWDMQIFGQPAQIGLSTKEPEKVDSENC